MHTLTIGLTGGIGSGKSAVSDWFARQGIDVIDADVIAHAITAKGSAVLDELVQSFGEWVVIQGGEQVGEYNRSAMRKHILNNPDAIHTLNAITHPHIQARIKNELSSSMSAYRILSVPLLVEGMDKPTSLATLCDRILVVDVPEKLQIQRALVRDAAKLSTQDDPAAYIHAIIQKQASRQARLAIADDVVDNGGTLDELYAQLDVLHRRYLEMAEHP